MNNAQATLDVSPDRFDFSFIRSVTDGVIAVPYFLHQEVCWIKPQQVRHRCRVGEVQESQCCRSMAAAIPSTLLAMVPASLGETPRSMGFLTSEVSGFTTLAPIGALGFSRVTAKSPLPGAEMDFAALVTDSVWLARSV